MLKGNLDCKTGERTQELVAWDHDPHAEHHAKNAGWRKRKGDAEKERVAECVAEAAEILKFCPALLSTLVRNKAIAHEHATAAGWKQKGKK